VNSVILGAGPAHAVYFGTYEIVKEWAGGNRPGHQFAATGKSILSNSKEREEREEGRRK